MNEPSPSERISVLWFLPIYWCLFFLVGFVKFRYIFDGGISDGVLAGIGAIAFTTVIAVLFDFVRGVKPFELPGRATRRRRERR